MTTSTVGYPSDSGFLVYKYICLRRRSKTARKWRAAQHQQADGRKERKNATRYTRQASEHILIDCRRRTECL